MYYPKELVSFLKKNNIDYFTGVPDSTIKEFCNYLCTQKFKKRHIIASNEGTALSIASGYYAATKKISLVYMQNSGLGNALNPILSLLDSKVYSIPALIFVGWRGEPGIKDEPQHKAQGLFTIPLLKSIKKKFFILNGNKKRDFELLKKAIKLLKKKKEPIFILCKKNIFNKTNIKKNFKKEVFTRRALIKSLIEFSDKNSILVSTTGYTSRELFEVRKEKKQNNSDFLTVGSMGHVSQIALGISLNIKKKFKKIFCIDGDGSFLMHMGSVATIGKYKPKNLIHILVDNSSHESVGGQPVSSKDNIFYSKIAYACGYNKVYGPIKTLKKINKIFQKIFTISNLNGPIFIHAKVKRENINNLGRPKIMPKKNLKNFIKQINN